MQHQICDSLAILLHEIMAWEKCTSYKLRVVDKLRLREVGLPWVTMPVNDESSMSPLHSTASNVI